MASDQVKRKLAAIVAADIAGYSRLMGVDEAGTLARLKEHRRELIDPKNKQYRGRVVKTTGDGILIEFPSVVDAVCCSIEVQQGMHKRNADVPQEKRIEFRIGINLGDVIIEGRDLYGDGVNIAARLEGLAEPGGICISQTVLNHARGKIAFDVEDLGEQALKNIVQRIRVYRLLVDSSRSTTIFRSLEPALALPDKPSIAVLPFQNMSGDPEQEYFADGVVEDIITALSRSKSLFVIARNSSFTYKGKAVDIKQVGRELGVRYVLEGSVRKAGSRVRIIGQLIDATTGAHLWADKFEGELQDVLDLQDSVATSVVGAIFPRLTAAAAELVKRKPPESWASYDFYLRGVFLQRTPDTIEQALDLFRKAIDLDQEFGSAHASAASCIFMRPEFGGRPVTDEERSEALQLTTRALALAGDHELVLVWAAIIFTYWNDELERGSDLCDRALVINPNYSAGWLTRGWLSVGLSDGARALDALDRAIRLNPADDWIVLRAMQGKISAFSLLERNSDALEMINRVLARRPNDLRGWFEKYAIYVDADPARAADAADHIRALSHICAIRICEGCIIWLPARSARSVERC
jgi:TolB-like protein/class 3 adenylate cyclase